RALPISLTWFVSASSEALLHPKKRCLKPWAADKSVRTSREKQRLFSKFRTFGRSDRGTNGTGFAEPQSSCRRYNLASEYPPTTWVRGRVCGRCSGGRQRCGQARVLLRQQRARRPRL